MDNLTEFFGEPIFVYGDADALSDGVLVDVGHLGVTFHGVPVNRMTSAVWHGFSDLDEAAATTEMQERCERAINPGGIYTLPGRIWMLENEVGGWTAMYPEDY